MFIKNNRIGRFIYETVFVLKTLNKNLPMKPLTILETK